MPLKWVTFVDLESLHMGPLLTKFRKKSVIHFAIISKTEISNNTFQEIPETAGA